MSKEDALRIEVKFNESAFKHGVDMVNMTEEEAVRLDEYCTETTQDFDSGKPGVFARQKDMAVVLLESICHYSNGGGLLPV